MDLFVHLVISLFIALAINYQGKYAYLFMAVAGICGAAVDLDHFLPQYTESGVKIFHNFFIFFGIPAAMLFASTMYERNKKSSALTRFSIMICVVMLGHMVLDYVMMGKMPFFYPFDSTLYTPSLSFDIQLHEHVHITQVQVAWIALAIMTLVARFVQGSIYATKELGRVPERGEHASSWAHRASKKVLRAIADPFGRRRAAVKSPRRSFIIRDFMSSMMIYLLSKHPMRLKEFSVLFNLPTETIMPKLHSLVRAGFVVPEFKDEHPVYTIDSRFEVAQMWESENFQVRISKAN